MDEWTKLGEWTSPHCTLRLAGRSENQASDCVMLCDDVPLPRPGGGRLEKQAAEQAAQHELHTARLSAELRELRAQLQATGAAAAAQREDAQRWVGTSG